MTYGSQVEEKEAINIIEVRWMLASTSSILLMHMFTEGPRKLWARP